MRITQQTNDTIGVRTPLLIHFFICSIGLLGLVDHVAGWAGQTFISPLNIFISYNEWANLSTEPRKPTELLQYALSVSVVAFYYIAVLVFMARFSSLATNVVKKVTLNRVVSLSYLGLLLLLNIGLLGIHGQFANIAFGVWFLVLALPVLPLVDSRLGRRSRGGGLWSNAVFAALIISLAYSFYPYISGGMPISNDYMDIPEQTILSTGIVDNTDYINTHRIGGLRKHDPRIGQMGLPTPGNSETIKLEKSEVLSKFVGNYPQTFAYDDKSGSLVVKQLLKRDDVDNLARMTVSEVERGRIFSFYYDQLTKAQTKKSYSPEEIEFINKNRREFLDQALAGHYFHHQHTMLGTINEYSLGKPQNQTVFVYGWLSTVVVAEAMKAIGGITFETYLKVFYSFYPIYYLLLVLSAAVLFKRTGYVLLVGLISFSSLYLLGFETIRFAPGFNPVRHFFDIFALVCFYWYLFAPRRNILYLALALCFSILGILFSKEFGIVLLLSMLATFFVRMQIDRRKATSEGILVVVTILAALVSLILIKTGKNPTLFYVLMGVATPPMEPAIMYGLLLTFSAIYLLLIKSRKAGDNWRYLLLFWFLYAQGLLIYYIWNPANNHLLSLGTVWALLLALLLRHVGGNYAWAEKYETKALQGVNVLLVLFIFAPSIGSYVVDSRDYQNLFMTHKQYHWNFTRANFVSTMDPKVFENSVQLINKYSTGSNIYILSKYDNILPFLSMKYSAMPFTEMGLSLVTKKEMDESANLIRHDRPEYIFVDADMTRSHVGDVYVKNDPLSEFAAPVYDASRGKAMVLDNFARVFNEIKSLYVPVEAGQLITVYKLQSGTH